MEILAIVAEARRMQEEGEDLERILAMMRAKGLSKVMSIKALCDLGFALGVAKDAVHHSTVWADVRSSHDEFSETVERALDNLGSSKDDEVQ